jgi:choice-of-anchor C domain-containing protein
MNRSCALLALLIVGVAARPSHADLIVNGGFETPVAPVNSFTTLGAGSSAMAPWSIVSGSVDVIGANYWPAFQGVQSLDLNGNSAGTISQSFTTTPGTSYTLSFAYANNADASTLTPTATVSVLDGANATLLSQDVSHTGSTHTNMNYSLFSASFVADSATTTLRFAGGTSTWAFGIVLDAVSVNPSVAAVPEPSNLIFGGLAALAGVAYARRRRG